jgi:thioredoxin
MTRMITREAFRKEVVESHGLSLVKFKIEWSGACQIISPIYEKLSNSYTGMVNFFTIDVERETGIDKEYGVIEFPTILFFRQGKIVDHVAGLVPRNVVIRKIENALSIN